ncbi:MAG TPA: ROK family protein [Bryobacteraceae bacterium]|nr:ROK family protein [Bryobacteraceae bacterium]
MRIGIDLGGTKIEALALGDDGRELHRIRVATPRHDYTETLNAIARLVQTLEAELGQRATVGVGIPGTIMRPSGLVKNANSTWLNGQPLERDLSAALSREVRCENDANCLALSEATDGSGAGYRVVFAVILGTGCGGGLAIDARVHLGLHSVAGEWGHNSLPWPRADEFPGPPCYCGKSGCIETWISGTGLSNDYRRSTGTPLSGKEVTEAADRSDPQAVAALRRLEDRIARSFASLVNVIDPDVIVIGGGLSRLASIYTNVPPLLENYGFGGGIHTPIVPARHGDSSGVRGAAWLWPATS